MNSTQQSTQSTQSTQSQIPSTEQLVTNDMTSCLKKYGVTITGWKSCQGKNCQFMLPIVRKQ